MRRTTDAEHDPDDRAAWEDVLPEVAFELAYNCPVRWEDMERVDDHSRMCERCHRVVFELSGRSGAEVLALYEAHGGTLCGQGWIREDGTLLLDRRGCAPRRLRGKIARKR